MESIETLRALDLAAVRRILCLATLNTVVDDINTQICHDDAKYLVTVRVHFILILHMDWHRLSKKDPFAQRAVNVIFLLVSLNLLLFLFC